ncbi:MAG: diguanylate cyclase [Armatimonadetes bacterium]|nr:diguanylate cyclase [Armatimonadota bacterium]
MEGKDRLTQLYTEEYLRMGLDQEFMRSRRFSRDLAFILLEPVIPAEARADMLYAVLKFLAKSVEAQTRQIDTGVRWGQQILVVLPETVRDGADRVGEKIGEHFARHTFTHPDSGVVIPVGLKVTVLVFPTDGSDKETILYNLRENIQAAEVKSGGGNAPAEAPPTEAANS